MTRFAALFAVVVACGLTASAALAQSQRPVCPGPVANGTARCFAHVIVDPSGKPQRTTTPRGYTPTDLQSAYGVPAPAKIAPGSSTATIAIVDAYHDPTAQSDLTTYRTQFGLGTCASGCFSQVNQSGGKTYPATDGGWAQEISLDLDMASAICPNCKLLLVEATNSSLTNLGAAARWAAQQPGVIAVSNSYGAPEFSTELSYASYYAATAGQAITVSTGDSGYGVQFPAALSSVVAVGGTSLNKDTSTSRGWSETAWSGAGSGCSSYVTQPTYQQPVSGCSGRIVADVSAVADPYTGVAVYDSTSYQGRSGWMVFGGTSAAAPIVAGVYANASSVKDASALYSAGSSLWDVTSGSTGSCGGSLLCTAGSGFDGPTGNGTPNGTAAF